MRETTERNSIPLDYRGAAPARAPALGTSLATTVGAASIFIGALGVVWNLLAITFASNAYQDHQSASQDRAAAEMAREAQRTIDPPQTIFLAPVVEPSTGLLVGMTLAVGAFVINMALGIILIAAGTLLLRRSPRAVPLHRLYAFVKLVAVGLAGIAWAWMLVLGESSQVDVTIAIVVALVIVILGCAYPVLLMAVMRQPPLLSEHAQGGP